jgi:YggT family protein
MGHFIETLAAVMNVLLTIMKWTIFVRAVLSWFSPDPYNPLVQFLVRVTEPILEPIRRLLPHMGIDISPIIAFFLIEFTRMFVVSSLYDLASRLQ